MKALLAVLAPYLAKRVLVSLGIGIVTSASITGIVNLFTSSITSNLNASGGIVLQMASLFGVPDAIGIILGAYSTVASLALIKKFALL